MTISLFVKASLVWLILAILAIANGVFRDTFLMTIIGKSTALPLSGVSLSIIVLIVTYLCFPIFGKNDQLAFFVIGIQWVVMTLMFEFIFGHYVAGKSWSSILQVFNIMKGDLFVIVLVISLISPILVAKMKTKGLL